jgi:hypothetical protein
MTLGVTFESKFSARAYETPSIRFLSIEHCNMQFKTQFTSEFAHPGL